MTTCTWTLNSDGGWDTSCYHCFETATGTPTENKMVFCCFCGRPLVERFPILDDEED